LGTLNILHEQLLFATRYTQLLKSRTVPALSLFIFYRYWHNRIQGVYQAQQSHTCPALLRSAGETALFIPTAHCIALRSNAMKARGFSAHLVKLNAGLFSIIIADGEARISVGTILSVCG
jgi:hypothetical protein